MRTVFSARNTCGALALWLTPTAALAQTPAAATGAAPSAPTPVAAQPAAAPTPQPAAPAADATFRPDAQGFINEWLVLAPLFYDPLWPAGELEIDKAQLAGEARLRPKAGDEARFGKDVRTWSAHTAPGALVDLRAATGGADAHRSLGYAVTYVVADAATKKAKLRVGTNDMAKVWWNGKPVIRHAETVGAAKKDSHGAFVDVKAGVNVLVMKVFNDEKTWGLYARLLSEAGAPLPVKVAKAPDGKGELAAPDPEGFIRDWLVVGPVPYPSRPFAQGQLAKKHLPGEESVQARARQEVWVQGQPHRWTPYAAQGGVLDFNAFINQHKRLVPVGRWEPNSTVFNPLGYAMAYVHAPADLRDVRVKLGANDHGLVYVNGRPTAKVDEPGALVKDKAEAKTALKKGMNTVVLKVVNAGDAWQGAVRFVTKDGAPITDLEVKLAPPPSEADAALR